MIYFFEPTSKTFTVAHFCIIFHYYSHDEVTRNEFMDHARINIDVIHLKIIVVPESLCTQKL